jgi:aryl-alcohol dehydrogenase-like predicted oxidoreductase
MDMRIGLGTVQFGMPYGVSNLDGQVSRGEVARILETAYREGVRFLDTASAYGESESVLGEALSGNDAFRIVTKTVPLRCATFSQPELEIVRMGFANSLSRLRCQRTDTLMVHHADDLLVPGGARLYEQLLEWRELGLANRIGASVYSAQQIDALTSRYELSVLQVPINVLDQRLVRDGTLSRLEEKGVAVHARSVFLQGLLLADPNRLPSAFARWHGLFQDFWRRSTESGTSPLEAAIGFVCRQPAVECVLVGVLSADHLMECVRAARTCRVVDLDDLASYETDLIDPREWKH